MDNWYPDKREAVIDGDLLVYAASAKFNDEPDNTKALEYVENELMYNIDLLALDDFTVYVTAKGNFRKDVSDTYKANRAKTEKPKYLVDCYKFLYKEWGASAEVGYEADDLMAIAITENPNKLLISYDKDLNQVPGWHYDWRKGNLYYVEPFAADYFLACQMLQGDPADNIKGVRGIGPKKAEKILSELETGVGLRELIRRVWQVYKDNNMGWDEFRTNYQLLKILRSREQNWPELNDILNHDDGLNDIRVSESVPVT